MKPRHLLFILFPLLLTACGLSPQEKADYSRVESSGVSPAIYDKMLHGDDLAISDVESLSRHGVSAGVITRYIRNQGTTYYLSSSDVKGLQNAGVDSSVVDYMLQTGHRYPGPYPYGGPYGGPYGPYGYGYGDPFWYGPGYYGPSLFIGGGFYGGRGYNCYRGGGYHH